MPDETSLKEVGRSDDGILEPPLPRNCRPPSCETPIHFVGLLSSRLVTRAKLPIPYLPLLPTIHHPQTTTIHHQSNPTFHTFVRTYDHTVLYFAVMCILAPSYQFSTTSR